MREGKARLDSSSCRLALNRFSFLPGLIDKNIAHEFSFVHILLRVSPDD